MHNSDLIGKQALSAYCHFNYSTNEITIFDTDNISEQSRIDEQITGKTTSDVEVKTRFCHYEDYDGAIMEVHKFKSLKNYSNNKKKYYFCYYPFDECFWLFDLTDKTEQDMEQTKILRKIPRTTEIDINDNEKINQWRYNIPYSWGKKYELKNKDIDSYAIYLQAKKKQLQL